ncbi:MAG TPA: CapA family protein [Candidatus Bathyarchaeia archaeon]|nr:CapA family protein [Candidatus Bathyarchaeia archaeon]
MLLKLKVLSKPGLAFAGLAIVALVLLLQLLGVKSRKVRWAVTALLTVAGAVAVASYLEFGQFRYDRYINPHDVFHYYMGSKYSREIGYSHLYASALVADSQMNSVYDRNRSIRSQEDYGYIPARMVLKDSAKYEGLFTPRRWVEFKRDIAFFQSRMPKAKWNNVLRDKGYNATPVWNMVARALANTFDTSSINALLFLDLAMLAAMLVMIWAAFGWNVAMLAAVFFASNFFMSFVHIRGAFLRLDWVALLVMSVCALKLGWYKTAGGMMAYAALARVFPTVFVFGIGACFVWDVIKNRRLSRRYVEFFAVFVLTVSVLVGLSIFDDGNLHLWREFSDKITLHNNDLSTTRVGFKYIFLDTRAVTGSWPQFVAAKQHEFAGRRLQWLAIQAAVLAACFLASRKLRDHEALALGFVPAFFLVAPTFYYHVMLIVPFMFFAARPESLSRLIGAAGMFALSAAAYRLNQKLGFTIFLSYVLSWMLLGLAAYQLAAAFLTRRDEETAGEVVATAKPAITRPQKALLCTVPVCWLIFAGVGLMRAHAGPAPASSALADRLKSQPGIVQLALTGDVMMARGVNRTLVASGQDFASPMMNVARYLRNADAAFCNLETAVSTLGQQIKKRYTFRSSPQTVAALSTAGFDVVSLANNHVLDFGTDALADTMKRLDAAGIKQAGVAADGARQQPVVLTAKGVKIGFLAYVDPESRYADAPEYDSMTGLRPVKATREQCAADISALKRAADIVVVSMHWGTEYIEKPDRRQVEFGRFLIDAGANIVAGHHPHVQQEPEWYRGGVIIHSMGNFVFDQWSRPLTRVSRLYRVYCDKTGVKGLEYLPLDKEKDTWLLFATSRRFIEVPAQPGTRRMPVKQPPAPPARAKSGGSR